MDKITKTNCATCSSPVLLNQSDEGTCFYTPLYRGEDVEELVEAAKDALRIINRFGLENCSLIAALEKFKDNETPPEVKG